MTFLDRKRKPWHIDTKVGNDALQYRYYMINVMPGTGIWQWIQLIILLLLKKVNVHY